jgi:sec-independent protein translocase protein TatB
MFDVGFAELFLLSVIGLLVLGPERLPAVARTLGGFMRKARASWNSLKRSIESEMESADVVNPMREAQAHLEAMQRKMNEPLVPSTDTTASTARAATPGDEPVAGAQPDDNPADTPASPADEPQTPAAEKRA